jgi:hypothetical protein
MKNRHGLCRYIPADVRANVRRRSGFGCVICGVAIITYEHFDPLFADATTHDPAGITLLCGHHQNESSKGLLSKETIATANGKPYCHQQGHAQSMFDLGGQQPPTLVLGTTEVRAVGAVLRINGSPVVQVQAPEATSSRWRLSATFPDRGGNVLCRIVENELQVDSGNFDLVQEANRFEIRDGERSVVLKMELEAPRMLRIVRFRWSTERASVEILDRCPSCAVSGGLCSVCSLLGPHEDRRRGWLRLRAPNSELTLEECRFYSDTAGLQVSGAGIRMGG